MFLVIISFIYYLVVIITDKLCIKMTKSYIITKKIAKHGLQSVIVIPSFLNQELKPRTIVQVKIDVIKEAEDA